MTYIKEEDNYIPNWTEQIERKSFEPELIPWINDPQINQDISIET